MQWLVRWDTKVKGTLHAVPSAPARPGAQSRSFCGTAPRKGQRWHRRGVSSGEVDVRTCARCVAAIGRGPA